MKNLKVFMFGILLVGVHLTSCKKDADQQLQKSTPAENQEKLFEKSLTVYNADKTNSTTLRFRAASKEQLDKMQLDNLEFTLVKKPESATEATDLAASTIPGDEGSSSFSNNDAGLPQSITEKQVLPEDGIRIDFPFESKTGSISIDVKSKDLNNSTMRSPALQAAAALSSNFYYKSGWHKIKVTNLHSSPIYAYLYNFYSGAWHYKNPGYKLLQNHYARQSNCIYTVGARVYHPASFHYVVNYYLICL